MKKKNKQIKVAGPSGRMTYKYIEGRKIKKPRPTSSELIDLLNAHGPLELSKMMNVSKVTMHNWMNHYGIESIMQWQIANTQQPTPTA